MAARLKKPAYGMSDAPRRWWNKLDKTLQELGMVPTRADRCVYVLYGDARGSSQTSRSKGETKQSFRSGLTHLDEVLDHLLDPVSGSQAKGKMTHGGLGLACR